MGGFYMQYLESKLINCAFLPLFCLLQPNGYRQPRNLVWGWRMRFWGGINRALRGHHGDLGGQKAGRDGGGI